MVGSLWRRVMGDVLVFENMCEVRTDDGEVLDMYFTWKAF
jgi:hypothetical protein